MFSRRFRELHAKGGVSWREAIELGERKWAQGEIEPPTWEDHDLVWMDLLEMGWNPDPPEGARLYTDAKSFGYYLAATLVVGLRQPLSSYRLAWKLRSCSERVRKVLNAEERQAVLTVVTASMQWCREENHRVALRDWNRALESLQQ